MGILTNDLNAERHDALFAFTNGVVLDRRIARQEIRVQKAWVEALVPVGILENDEAKRVQAALDDALIAIEAGRFEWRIQDEDIHMNLERFVTERTGDLGKRMHIGRSRNDLIATTLRLFVADSLDALRSDLKTVSLALADQAEKTLGVVVPGMTHLQHGQPIRFGHALAAHGWALSRDRDRLRDARSRALHSMPLGSAALGGTSIGVDLSRIARDLGFDGPSRNSYDSVGDRDFVLESLSALSLVGVHLSRLAEDLIIWSSTALGLIRLPKAFSTGSSIMPNKRNPDVPELVRAKSAHLIGAATEAHVLVKGVPTSYGSDLHEVKSVYLRALDETHACLGILPGFLREMSVNEARAEQLLLSGHILATEIADELALRHGLPFREAYRQVAALVEVADRKGVQVHQLTLADAQTVAPQMSAKFLAGLGPERAVELRRNAGGTARAPAQDGIRRLRDSLGAD